MCYLISFNCLISTEGVQGKDKMTSYNPNGQETTRWRQYVAGAAAGNLI
jgi:hypothetical protein